MKSLLWFILGLIAVVLAFCIVVLVVGTVNHMSFYEVLQLWFGHGSWFASLFNK